MSEIEIEALRRAIRKLHGLGATHIVNIPVKETFNGETVWEGEVSIFGISGHPQTAVCYAWAHQDDNGKTQYTAVLGLPPVKSAQDAVRAALAAKLRNEGKET